MLEYEVKIAEAGGINAIIEGMGTLKLNDGTTKKATKHSEAIRAYGAG